MKKSTKGALAAGAAAVLLLGGAGTLAYWSDSIDLPGGSVTSGELKLENADCDDDWVYAAGSASAGQTVNLFVPGDVISKKCTFDIVATGDNLSADLVVPSTATFASVSPAAPSFSATVAATYEDADGDPLPATITDANDGTVTATINVTFPYGTGQNDPAPENINDTQAVTATLDAITVSVEQNDPN
jgi:alternate signal-mediated exported protein